MPQLLAYQAKYQTLPSRLTFALAALIAFYQGKRNGQVIPLQDDEIWLVNFKNWWQQVDAGEISIEQLVRHVLSQTAHWETDLTAMPQLVETVAAQLENILAKGMREALSAVR